MKINITRFFLKRHFKSTISFFIVLLLIVPLTLSVFADSSNTTIDPLAIINRYRPHFSDSYAIVSQKQLRGFSGNTYTLYQLSPCGYAILMDNPCRLMEASFNADSVPPIDMNDSAVYYYGGPTVYCKATADGILNVYDNTLLSSAQIENITKKESFVHQSKQSVATTASTASTYSTASDSSLQVYTVEYNYFAYLTQFSVIDNLTYSATAAQILLGYYDSFVNEDVIDSQYHATAYTGHGTTDSFHTLLVNYIYYDQDIALGAVSFSSAVTGINNYLATRSLCMHLIPVSAKGTMIQIIKSNIPIYTNLLIDGSANNAHMCIAYGVQYEESDIVGTAVFTVNLGTDSDSNFQSPANCHLLVDGDWLQNGAYMNSSSHVYSITDYNVSSHRKACVDCNNVFYESHSPFWNAEDNLCTRCGHTGLSAITPNTAPCREESY